MGCGTGPERLGYGGCTKGLILKDNERHHESETYKQCRDIIRAVIVFCVWHKWVYCSSFLLVSKCKHVLLHQLGVSPPASLLVNDAK